LSVASKASNFLSSLLNIISVAYLVKKKNSETELGKNQNRFSLNTDDRHMSMHYINKNSVVTVPTDGVKLQVLLTYNQREYSSSSNNNNNVSD
jgi:hypothetical protein